MSHRVVSALVAAAALAGSASSGSAGEPGEFSIPITLPLDARQIDALREIIRKDAEARALADAVRREAEPLLDAQPRPLEEIHYEGLVNTDPRRIATVEKLRDMSDVARLLNFWQASGNAKAAAALERYIVAWSSTYRVTGNDVNENKFYPLLCAYAGLRGQMAPARQQAVDAWVRAMGEAHRKAVAKSEHYTNRYGKSLRILAVAGGILGEKDWLNEARAGVQRFVTHSLRADGTSLDLERRDSLGYHGSSLKEPMDLAVMLGPDGRDLYTWQNTDGGSIKKSVDYVVPYALGEKTRQEWRNSKVDLDRRRAEAGLEHYRPGREYRPEEALELMEKASYFDPDLVRVVVKIVGGESKRFPTWRVLLNEAARPARAEAPAGG